MTIPKFSIKSSLILSYSILMLSALTVGLAGYRGIREIYHQNEIAARANRILVDAEDAQANSLRYIIYGDKYYHDEMEKEMGNIFTIADELEELIRDENERFHVTDLEKLAHAYRTNNLDYYDIDVKKQDAGKIRVEKALLIMEEIIDVIDEAKDFSLSTERRFRGTAYLEKSSVERSWLVQNGRNGINRFRILAQKYQLAVDAEDQDRVADQWISGIRDVRVLLQDVYGVMKSPVTRDEIQAALRAIDEYEKHVNTFLENNRAQRGIQAEQKENSWAVMQEARNVRDYSHEKIIAATNAAVKEMIIVLIGTLLIAVIIVIVMLRRLFRNLGCEPIEIQEITRSIAEGNLSLSFGKKNKTGAYASMKEMSDQLTSIIGQIQLKTQGLEDVGTNLSTSAEESSASLNMIADNLETMNSQIRNQHSSVDELASAVSKISGNIDSLNSSIEEQASQVIESSSAIEEMVSSIESVSDNMKKVTQSAEELNEASLNGLEKITSSNELINNVADESRKLMETNQLISNIASQTNLLAMNAAIEAAHAGDAGRGFSVVADEIRKLAESTTMQSHEVGNTLNLIQQLIAEIVASSENTTDSFSHIQDKVKLVRDRSDEISFALTEQSSGSKQVLEALTSMTQISETVRTDAGEINDHSSMVLDEIMSLRKISEDSTLRIDELVSGSSEIKQAVENVMTISNTNKDIVEGIVSAMSFFSIEKQGKE